jgi:hypothetical protein
MEQVREARAREQAEAQVEAAKAKAGEVVAKVAGVVLPLVRVVIAFAPSVVKERPIKWGRPVMNNHVLSAEQL